MATDHPAPAPAVSGQTPALFPAKLFELAMRGAAEAHWDAIAEASISFPTTHKEPFHVCPHGNCKLVREYPASAPVASAPKDETKEDVQSRVDGE